MWFGQIHRSFWEITEAQRENVQAEYQPCGMQKVSSKWRRHGEECRGEGQMPPLVAKMVHEISLKLMGNNLEGGVG